MEMKLPKSLIVGIWVVGIGLVLNGVQPFIGTPAVASNGIQKVAICDVNVPVWCADVGLGPPNKPNMSLHIVN